MEYQDERLLMEQTLVGAMVMENNHDRLDMIFKTGIKPKHFRSTANRLIFEALLKVHSYNLPLSEPAHLIEALGENLAEVGGHHFIYQLANMGGFVKNPESYAIRVIEHWARQDMMIAARAAEDLEWPMRDGLARIAQTVEGAYKEATLASGSGLESGMLGDFIYSPPSGIATGMRLIDENQSCHGYPRGQVTIVGAKQKGGKTAFLTQTLLHACQNGASGGYALFADLDEPSLQMRCMKYLTGMQDTPKDFEGLRLWDDGMATLKAMGIRTMRPQRLRQPKTVELLESWLASETQHDNLDILMVDYAQKIESSNPKADSLYNTAVIVSDKLSELADRYQIAIVVGSQITTSKEAGDTTKGGRVWEEDAGLIVRIETPNIEADRYERLLKVAYSRFGPSGDEVKAKFDPTRLAIVEVGDHF